MAVSQELQEKIMELRQLCGVVYEMACKEVPDTGKPGTVSAYIGDAMLILDEAEGVMDDGKE